MDVTSLCLTVLLMAHLTSCYPTGTGLTGTGLTGTRLELQDLLDRLESLVDQGPVEGPRGEEVPVPRGAQEEQQEEQQEEALIRELLSPQNLMSVRNNSPRGSGSSSSSCFGRRMDRIGSMSSLGCNTLGKNSPKSA